jgi:hypothetical protein
MSTMITLTAEEYQSLLAERERLSRQLRAVMVERDLLKERLDAHRRRLFAARSEARPAAQGDLFLNEAEALAPPGTPVAEEAAGGGLRRGRTPPPATRAQAARSVPSPRDRTPRIAGVRAGLPP